MTTPCSFPGQITNRNFLSPAGFKFTLAKEPKVSFFCNTVRIPEINLALALQPTYLKDIDVPGEKLTYGDLSLKFLVDENLENYMAIHNWLTGLGFPETPQQFADLLKDEDDATQLSDLKDQFSDGSLTILNSNFKTAAVVKFIDLFPYSLTSLDFDATITDVQYFTAEASFKYTVYNILGADGRNSFMNLDDIQEMWQKDSVIDPDNLHDESLKIPQLHSKYYTVYNTITLLREKARETYNRVKLERYNYYTGKAPVEVYEEEPFPYKVRDKEALQRHMDGDEKLSKIELKIRYYDIMLKFLEEVIKTISNRTFQIKNAIEWHRFQAGFN